MLAEIPELETVAASGIVEGLEIEEALETAGGRAEAVFVPMVEPETAAEEM